MSLPSPEPSVGPNAPGHFSAGPVLFRSLRPGGSWVSSQNDFWATAPPEVPPITPPVKAFKEVTEQGGRGQPPPDPTMRVLLKSSSEQPSRWAARPQTQGRGLTLLDGLLYLSRKRFAYSRTLFPNTAPRNTSEPLLARGKLQLISLITRVQGPLCVQALCLVRAVAGDREQSQPLPAELKD